ncbi:CCA tRNA nucleotidyltransferase [Novosphingobium piscinae]|uniref:CCA tRNA nucleotidyltransferase n=1 Tax=Novosphingobium piscinae TaxID=1507448 RepID=A0A7X1FXA6_9SPHN|nr:CCA tRNA nucleotidyltransferase [Novosphingobium piscinae]MBC2668695.1 CCA tRNA nucleotidyltransferase [Novosphingobium piscinae]
MTELPAAAWTERPDLHALVAALGAGNARYVGGAVRDTLLGLAVKDIDMATPLPPDAVMARLAAAGIRVVPTGIAHGTVTAVLAAGPVEITTLRRDVSTDGRHATVAFAAEWEEDAARRDFTINALYADPVTRTVHDWFGGLADLAGRRVRFIGEAAQRIREDHLRILRYFRFQARFGSLPADAEAEAACAELAPMLKGLSRERVAMELLNLLALPDPAPTLSRMAALGVLTVILPEGNPAGLPALVAAEQREAAAPDPLRRLAALLPAQPALADQVGARLRLSTAQRKRLVTAAARAAEPAEPARALAYRLGLVEASDRLLLAGASLAPLHGWTMPRLPLKGGDIVARGIGAGPEVARVLRAVETRWVAEDFPAGARVQELLDAVLAGR